MPVRLVLSVMAMSLLLMAAAGCGKEDVKSGQPRIEGELSESAKNLGVVGVGGGNPTNQDPNAPPQGPDTPTNPGQTGDNPTTPVKKIQLAVPNRTSD